MEDAWNGGETFTLSCCKKVAVSAKGFQPMFCTGRAYLEAWDLRVAVNLGLSMGEKPTEIGFQWGKWWWTTINHDKTWWAMMSHDEAWWAMMNHDEAWWSMMKHDEAWWTMDFLGTLSSHKPIHCSTQLWGREGQTWKHTPEEDHRPRKKGCRMLLDGQSSGMFLSKTSSTGQNFKSGLRPWLPGVLRRESAALRADAGEALIFLCRIRRVTSQTLWLPDMAEEATQIKSGLMFRW